MGKWGVFGTSERHVLRYCWVTQMSARFEQMLDSLGAKGHDAASDVSDQHLDLELVQFNQNLWEKLPTSTGWYRINYQPWTVMGSPRSPHFICPSLCHIHLFCQALLTNAHLAKNSSKAVECLVALRMVFNQW